MWCSHERFIRKKIKDGNTDDEIYKFFHSSPSTFHKMIEGTPNFHRWIDEEASEKYWDTIVT